MRTRSAAQAVAHKLELVAPCIAADGATYAQPSPVDQGVVGARSATAEEDSGGEDVEDVEMASPARRQWKPEQQFLCKWTNLPYSSCTWETFHSVRKHVGECGGWLVGLERRQWFRVLTAGGGVWWCVVCGVWCGVCGVWESCDTFLQLRALSTAGQFSCFRAAVDKFYARQDVLECKTYKDSERRVRCSAS